MSTKGYVKTVGGKTRWIAGRVTPGEALAVYHRKAAAWAASRRPAPPVRAEAVGGSISVNYLINRWLQARQRDVDAGELSSHAYAQYRRTGKMVDGIIGAYQTGEWTPDTTQHLYEELRRQAESTSLAKRMLAQFASACLYAEDRRWCDPVAIGRQVLRKLAGGEKSRRAWSTYDVDEIHTLIARAYAWAVDANKLRPGNVQLLTMIVLALNGGLGASELAQLRRESVDVARSIIRQPRGKTGVDHLIPLWPEAVDLLKLVLAQPRTRGDSLVFRTRYGRPWVQQYPILTKGRIVDSRHNDSVNDRFKELAVECGLRRPGIGFYKFKHVHSTIADQAGDPHATFVLAGHKLPGARSHYVEVGVDRVRKVVQFIREHLRISQLACLEPASIEALKYAPAASPSAGEDPEPETAAAPAGE